MTRLLVILIALLVAWLWISRMVRGLLQSPRASEARSFLRLLQVLRRSAGGAPGTHGTGDPRSARGPAGFSSGPAGRGSKPTAGTKPAGALRRCRRCGVHVPEAQLTAGECGNCSVEVGAG